MLKCAKLVPSPRLTAGGRAALSATQLQCRRLMSNRAADAQVQQSSSSEQGFGGVWLKQTRHSNDPRKKRRAKQRLKLRDPNRIARVWPVKLMRIAGGLIAHNSVRGLSYSAPAFRLFAAPSAQTLRAVEAAEQAGRYQRRHSSPVPRSWLRKLQQIAAENRARRGGAAASASSEQSTANESSADTGTAVAIGGEVDRQRPDIVHRVRVTPDMLDDEGKLPDFHITGFGPRKGRQLVSWNSLS